MPVHEVVYPITATYDSGEGPGHQTKIVAVDSGAEERTTPWNGAQMHFFVSHNPQTRADLQELQAFARRRQGAVNGFLYKSSLDYSSAADGGSSYTIPVTNLDQLLGVGDGATVAFQLVKRYEDDVVSRTRNITRPILGTVAVALNGVDQPSGWSLNGTTGVLTFDVAPGLGVEVTAGFQFRVPVRFGEGVDKLLRARFENFAQGSIEVELVELIDEVPAQDEYHYRGGAVLTLNANMAITLNNGCALAIEPVGATRTVTLPAVAGIPMGGPHFFIRNASVTQNLLVKDVAGTTLATMSPGATRTVALFDAGGGMKQWLAW